MRLVITSLGFGNGDNLGGSSRVAGVLARGAAAAGHQVDFFCTDRVDKFCRFTPRRREYRDGCLQVHYLPTHTLPRWPGDFGPHWVRQCRRLRAAIAAADVVHLHETRHMLNWVAARRAAALGVPFVLQPHGTIPIFANSLRLKRTFDVLGGSTILREASMALALTASEAELIAAAGVPPARVRQFPNGIDGQAYLPLPPRGQFRRRAGIPDGVPLLVAAGRLVPYKGFDVLIRALGQIRGHRPWLAIAGAPTPYAGDLRQVAHEAGVDERVVLAGAIPNQQIMTLFVDGDLMVLPSRVDMFPLVILEAALAGRAMVLSSACHAAPLFAGRCAQVAAPEPEPMAVAIQHLLDEPGRCLQFETEAARLARNDYSLAGVTNELIRLYHEVQTGRTVA